MAFYSRFTRQLFIAVQVIYQAIRVRLLCLTMQYICFFLSIFCKRLTRGPYNIILLYESLPVTIYISTCTVVA